MSARRWDRTRTAVAVAAVTMVTLAGTTAAQAVTGADEGANEGYRFAARIQIGGELGRGCSGALVAPQWVLTAKACVGAGTPAGIPAEAVTVTVGRTDLRATTGSVLPGTWLAPHPDRDVVLIRLSTRVTDVPVVPIGTAAPRTGDELRLLGFGRTATAWVPDRLHGATAAVGAVGAATLDLTATSPSGATVCKGDAGGPAVRTSGGRTELVAVHHLSGQQGCLDASGTTPQVVETRVDDLAGWIAATAVAGCSTAGATLGADQDGVSSAMGDWTGDCSADILNQNTAGELHVFRGTGNLSGLFPSPRRKVGAGWTLTAMPRMISGDFNGDGRTDLIGQNAAGDLRAWPSTGDLSADDRLFPATSGVLVGTGWRTTQVESIVTADVDGDGRTDIIGRYADGRLRTWRSTGDLSADGRLLTGASWQSPKVFTPAAYPRLLAADVTGDRRADLIAQDADGQLFAWSSTGDFTGATPLWQEPARLIGTGWKESQVPLIATGDVTGDGRADLGARYTDGRLRFWASTGDLSADGRLLAGANSLITGTFTAAAYPRILIGDADHDGRADVVLQASDGRLLAYRSTGDASADGRLFPGPAAGVGVGWTVAAYPRIF
ncbi:FG-GAP-like repeat-containing protein [Jidongwangia harbinensis]|uniref:FG-GAP-like repeat-containing protein n=1 Tax=Jidongwangia harbinensis TaxID=2878561 RepID=UPI001CD965A2|nr:FG-GAP-like repeat-containing protein [Jidongwangia harbinensis]MCA2213030.1 FG-GAP-like repeat-containing protein [Jidongwangia harbinensis]